MKDITSFLPVVLWQGFLRPIDLRIEIETFNEDLQVQGSQSDRSVRTIFFASAFGVESEKFRGTQCKSMASFFI